MRDKEKMFLRAWNCIVMIYGLELYFVMIYGLQLYFVMIYILELYFMMIYGLELYFEMISNQCSMMKILTGKYGKFFYKTFNSVHL